MIYFVSRQRVSIKDGNIIKNARRRKVGDIIAKDQEAAIYQFQELYSDVNDGKFRYELTNGQWQHIAYLQQGVIT